MRRLTARILGFALLAIPGLVLAQADTSQYASLGTRNMAAGYAGKAAEDFALQLQANPFDPGALNNLAVARAEQGRYDQAERLLQRASRLAPDNATIAANLSRLRSYIQGYAMAGVNAPGESGSSGYTPSADSGLPPPPPPLWGQSNSTVTANSDSPYNDNYVNNVQREAPQQVIPVYGSNGSSGSTCHTVPGGGQVCDQQRPNVNGST